MDKIYAGIALNLDTSILQAAFPLLQNGEIEAIEWSFDSIFHVQNIPEWFIDLIDNFSKNDRLVGHGVFFSLFSGKFSENQKQWLKNLTELSQKFNFNHITEHFGFMTGEDFHKGAPLSIPKNEQSLNLAKDRIFRIFDACKKPVGLENLAFAYNKQEVERHGVFLKEILQEINGFLILDLHNLYCNCKNFAITFDEILKTYPLEMVREVHISGGSWEQSSVEKNKTIRRDTHDDAVPDEVFGYLHKVIPLLPNLKFVILEQIGLHLKTKESKVKFQKDFLKMKEICKKQNALKPKANNNFLPVQHISKSKIFEDIQLYNQQNELSSILENALSFEDAKSKLNNSSLKNTDWQIEHWENSMLETAFNIAQKWRKGFELKYTQDK